MIEPPMNNLEHHPLCRPVIVLEGPDGSGKSTLAERLSHLYQWPVVHTGGPIGSREEYFKRLTDKNLRAATNVIFDRVPMISELIYPMVQGRANFIGDDEAIHDLCLLRPVVIYCRLADPKRMLDRVLSSPKAHKSPEFLEKVKLHHDAIVRRYDAVMRLVPRCLVIPFDWEAQSWGYLEGAILQRIEACAD